MYEEIEAVRHELKQLPSVLTSIDAHERVSTIRAAFAATAQRISDKTHEARNESERADMQTLYRGMVAAQRMVERMADLAYGDTPMH